MILPRTLRARQGTATAARVVAADGSEIFSCDVGDENSDAVVRLTYHQINRGAPVLINSFRLGDAVT